MKKILAISDLHCGHKVGLTPPSQWAASRTKEGKLQRGLWDGFERSIQGMRGCDVLLVLGDCIDGKGHRSGGSEQLTTDMIEQTEWATECLKYIKPKQVAMVAGTPYHAGEDTDYEGLIAKELGAEFGGQLWVEVDGVTFNLRHKVGSSQLPHTRHTAIARERLHQFLWSDREAVPDQFLWSDREAVPESQVILRGHTHYHVYSGGADWVAMILPALQGLGSKFGERQCGGIVDFGAVHFTVDKGEFSWDAKLQTIKQQQKKAICLG
jgi:predicted phosphodiesterase